MHYLVRAAEEKDMPAVYHFICLLEETEFDKTLFAAIYTENIGSKNCVCLVADSGDTGIAGFISCHLQNLLHHCGRVAEIQELFVAETLRGKHIGELLVKEMEIKLREKGCISFEVTAQNKRTATHHFYEKQGFAATHKKFVKHLR